MPRSPPLAVSPGERRTLRNWSRADGGPSRRAVRARVVLAAAEGLTNAAVAQRVGVTPETAARWRTRFRALGLEGLRREAPRAGASTTVPRELIEKVLHATLARPPSGVGREWTTRSLARALNTSHMTVHRIWQMYRFRARRGTDPSPPESPVWVDLAGVFRHPGASAVVFAQERGGPSVVRPPAPPFVAVDSAGPLFATTARAARELGEVLRATAPRHARGTGPAPDSGSLLVFLRAVEQRTGPSVRLEAIFDRPLDRLGDRVVAWLRAHPRYRAYPTENAEEFARSAEAWPNRWERSALRPDSFEQLRSYESDGKGRPLRRVAEPNPTRSGRGSGAPARPSTDK